MENIDINLINKDTKKITDFEKVEWKSADIEHY
jgi:hypothetical protein